MLNILILWSLILSTSIKGTAEKAAVTEDGDKKVLRMIIPRKRFIQILFQPTELIDDILKVKRVRSKNDLKHFPPSWSSGNNLNQKIDGSDWKTTPWSWNCKQQKTSWSWQFRFWWSVWVLIKINNQHSPLFRPRLRTPSLTIRKRRSWWWRRKLVSWRISWG